MDSKGKHFKIYSGRIGEKMNIFLDLGTHYGQGLREFIDRFKMDSSWIIHTFEANPNTYKVFMDEYHKLTPWVIPHNEAVSAHYGTLTVNIETPPNEDATGMGSSVIDLDNWNPWGGELRQNFNTKATVPCIDLSDFISKNFKEDDTLIIKMDIEGSEYETLEKMINDNIMERVNFIAVEWHSRFFVKKLEIEEKERNIIKRINELNINLESWK
jgi:FkbM family methyltransferase